MTHIAHVAVVRCQAQGFVSPATAAPSSMPVGMAMRMRMRTMSAMAMRDNGG
jgi:hypothetical protein